MEDQEDYDDIEPMDAVMQDGFGDTYGDEEINEDDELYDEVPEPAVELSSQRDQSRNFENRKTAKSVHPPPLLRKSSESEEEDDVYGDEEFSCTGPIFDEKLLETPQNEKRKSPKSGPPPPIPNKKIVESKKNESIGYHKRGIAISIHKDSSFDTDSGDQASPEVMPTAANKILPFKPPLPSKPNLPTKPTVPARKPNLAQKSHLHDIHEESRVKNTPVSNMFTPTHFEKERASVGRLQIQTKPLTSSNKSPKLTKPGQSEKLESKVPHPRASLPIKGNFTGELGAALERRRLASVGIEENKVVSEANKPKFVGILQR